MAVAIRQYDNGKNFNDRVRARRPGRAVDPVRIPGVAGHLAQVGEERIP